MITHAVMYRFHKTLDVDGAVELLRAMAGTIPSLGSVRVGRNVNPGSAAYQLILITEHESAEALEAYQSDPRHLEIVAWMSPRVRDRAVVDSTDLG